MVPWPVRFLVVPVATAVALCRLDYDGRPAHEAALARAASAISPSKIVAFDGARHSSAEVLGDVVLAPDERSPTLRRGRVAGTGSVAFRVPVEARRHGRDFEIKPGPNRPLLAAPVIQLGEHGRLLVR